MDVTFLYVFALTIVAAFVLKAGEKKDARDKKKAILAIYSGLFLATAIMCFVVYTIPWLLNLF